MTESLQAHDSYPFTHDDFALASAVHEHVEQCLDELIHGVIDAQDLV